MDTAVISHRVADFLRKHAPFHSVGDSDLLALARGGRVKFYEPNEYILWQGEPHRHQVFVIQQGTVSLWDDAPDGAKLRDIRGGGDMLGIERYNDARACLHSARSESDVVIYAFPAEDFEAFVLKYPDAARYVAAESRVAPDYQAAGERRDLSRLFLHDLTARRTLAVCSADDSIANVAGRLLASRSGALVVVDADHRARGVLSSEAVLAWVASGAGDGKQRVETLLGDPPLTMAPNASVADGLLKIAANAADGVAITDDGTPQGRVQSLITRRDLAPLFGHDPSALLQEIRVAANSDELRDLNQRTRAFVFDQLAAATSVDWLSHFAHLVDAAILTRVAAIAGVPPTSASWCFGGSSGRAESLTALAPMVLAVFEDGIPDAVAQEQHQRVLAALTDCGYLPRLDLPFDASFYAASAREWHTRFRDWIRDPVRQETYRARSLFDLRAVYGRQSLWQDLKVAITEAVGPKFVHVLANDCLAILPPLTFFENAVVDSFGEQETTFRLEESALRPLVDVGRVFGLAARDAVGRSTIERLVMARALLPEQEAIFRDAADTLRVVLWQQGRVGISQGTRGAELPAALLSRHDRQVLKTGFRSIQRLLEFTADLEWLKKL